MKTLSALFTALLVFLAAPFAQADTPAQPARPALWKVADKDTTIYLFGTVHALPAGIAWYRGPVAEAFESAREVVTEIPETEPAQMQAIVAAKALLPRDQTLRGLMTPVERAKFEAGLATLKVPAGGFDRFEPWFAAITLASLPLIREGYVPDNGVENVLEARAQKLGRVRTGLETPEYQLGLFDSLPAAVQKLYLLEVVESLPDMAKDLSEIIAAWKAGDADHLARLMNEQEDDPEVMRILLFQRNKAWADWIKARLDKPGKVFIAVGAGHLAGPGSVQDELTARGVTFTRVQ